MTSFGRGWEGSERMWLVSLVKELVSRLLTTKKTNHYNMTPSLNEDHCSSHSASMKVIQLGLSRFSNVCEFCANYDFHNSCLNRCHSKFLFLSLLVKTIFIFLSSADNFFRNHR